MMKASPNRNKSWINVIACICLGLVGLSISAVVILSLIPVYLRDDSVTTSNKTRSGRAFNDVPWTFRNLFSRLQRLRRDIPSSFTSTLPMTIATESSFNAMFNDFEGNSVIPQPTILSGDQLMELIKRSMTKGRPIRNYKQKHAGYNKDRIFNRHMGMTLQTDESSSKEVPRSIQTSIESLTEQTNPYESIQTIKCIPISSDEFQFKIKADDSKEYRYYCFNWTATKRLEMFVVSFEVNGNDQHYVYLDDVILNTTSNFIVNGGFESASENVWNCKGSCSSNYVKDNAKAGQLSFRADKTVPLAQVVSKPIEGRNEAYHFGFWLKFECQTSDSCDMTANIGMPNAV